MNTISERELEVTAGTSFLLLLPPNFDIFYSSLFFTGILRLCLRDVLRYSVFYNLLLFL